MSIIIYQLDTRYARQELGFGDTIPKNAERPMTKLSDELWYTVDRSTATMECNKWGHRISRRPHRVFVQCPACNLPIPAGRLHQHIPSHAGWKHFYARDKSNYRHRYEFNHD